MKISMSRQMKTNPTNIWKEPIFFLPIAVLVHGQLTQYSITDSDDEHVVFTEVSSKQVKMDRTNDTHV
jgi:hypothetical protein